MDCTQEINTWCELNSASISCKPAGQLFLEPNPVSSKIPSRQSSDHLFEQSYEVPSFVQPNFQSFVYNRLSSIISNNKTFRAHQIQDKPQELQLS